MVNVLPPRHGTEADNLLSTMCRALLGSYTSGTSRTAALMERTSSGSRQSGGEGPGCFF
jgi:hypothetical protein